MTRCLVVFLLLALVSGCVEAPPPAVFGPVIVLSPPPVRARVVPEGGILEPAAAAVERDTVALRGKASVYVARAGSETIDRLTTLTLQSRRSIERMRANKTRHGYRPLDVAAARVAADALASFLKIQAPTVPIYPEWSGP